MAALLLAMLTLVLGGLAHNRAVQGGRATQAGGRLFSESRPAMGTVFTIYLYAPNRAMAAADFEAAFDEIERVEEALSNYRETSELARINREAAKAAVTTDPEVFQLLEISLDYARRSGGAFDITVGPLMRAWGFFRGRGHYPTPAELERARANVGWEHVTLETAARTVRFDRAGMELDLGGIGKGYAVDQVMAVLREAGVKAALVDAGSSTLFALGAPPGRTGWRIRVPNATDRKHTLTTVELRDTSLSTSGNYEKFFRLNGRVYCHIMDPRTGEPVQGTIQTTVIAPTATASDALSTAIFVLGPLRGRELLATMGGTRALWLRGSPAAAQVVTWRWPAKLNSTTNVYSKRPRCKDHDQP